MCRDKTISTCYESVPSLIGTHIYTDNDKITHWYDGPIGFIAQDAVGVEYLFRLADTFDDPKFGWVERYEVERPCPSIEVLSTKPMSAWEETPGITHLMDVRWTDLAEHDGTIVRAKVLKDRGQLFASDTWLDPNNDIIFLENGFHKCLKG